MAQLDPDILQTALLQVAEATQAASKAAQAAAQSASQVALSPSASAGQPKAAIDWSKLVNKPPVFGENATADEDIRLFRDWLWQLTQFLVTIDSEYESEVKQVTDDPTKPLDLSSASTDTRGRAAKLYGLMSSLVRCRALAIVKAVPSGNGYEALRQLVLAMRPNTQSRGLAMLASLTSWGAFQMNKPLHAQLLKLEEGFEERRKTGVQMPDELKTAMVLRCISGALKTQLSLQLDENATYTTVREAILRWDRSQQKWHTLLQGDSTDAVPMEIDRVEGRGHGKSKGKGKNNGKNDGNQKGKTKGKSKSKTGKGKSNWDFSNKGKGKSQKGKGQGDNKSEKQCYNCGGSGHFARDCWHMVRSAQTESVNPPSSTAQTSSSWSNVGSGQAQSVGSVQSSGHQSGHVQQATQHRVSRIFENSSDDPQGGVGEPFIFDLRSQHVHGDSSGRVIYHYIGAEFDAVESSEVAEVRAIVTECPDDEMSPILLDSGADAAVFPAKFATAGQASDFPATRLHDAQGRAIPVLGMRDVEVQLLDQNGKMVVIREHVAISDQIQQPILCFGKLLESGWGVCSREQVLTHPAGVKIPIELQNKSMTVHGWIRVLGEKHDNSDDMIHNSICAVKATVGQELERGPIGWNLDETGCGVGRHYAECFQDPTLAFPQMSGPKYRTTLVKDQDSWLVMELCEHVGSIIDLSSSFHQLYGPRDVITVVTDVEKDPEIMGFCFADDEVAVHSSGTAGSAGDFAEGVMAPEDELEGVDIPEAVSDLPAGAYVIEPFDEDKVLVNGVELTIESKLADLRNACGFFKLSQSGSKERCYKRIVNFLKQHHLELIDAVAHRLDTDLQRHPNAPPLAEAPNDKEVQKHNLTHLPYKPWCPACVSYRARADKQIRDNQTTASSVPCISFDFAYTKSMSDREDEQVGTMVALVYIDSQTGFLGCVPVRSKGQYSLMVQELVSFPQLLGYTEVVYRADNEPTARQLLKLVVDTRLRMGLPTRSSTPPPYSHGNALAENCIARIRGLTGSLMFSLFEQLNMKFSTKTVHCGAGV